MAAAAAPTKQDSYHIGSLQSYDYTCGAMRSNALTITLNFKGGLIKTVFLEYAPRLHIAFNDFPQDKVLFFKDVNVAFQNANPCVFDNVKAIGAVMQKVLPHIPASPPNAREDIRQLANDMVKKIMYNPQEHLEEILRLQQIDGQAANPEALAFVQKCLKEAEAHIGNMTKILGPFSQTPKTATPLEYIDYIRKQTAENPPAKATAAAAAAQLSPDDAAGCCIA